MTPEKKIYQKIFNEIERAKDRGRKKAFLMSVDLTGVYQKKLKETFEGENKSIQINRVCVNCSKAKYDIILEWT